MGLSETMPRTDFPANTAASAEAEIAFPFVNTYARLPQTFHRRTDPVRVAAPKLIRVNDALARQLGLDPEALRSPAGVEVLAGNRLAAGSEPLAIAYAGHQFGNFVPQLGDGRANLLGEVVGLDGKRYDIQLKGSGPTPFSRRGDGRAALGPVLREYILSEAMAGLGVPSTRALAAVTTGQVVLRETPQPGAVFTRVAASHLRVGTFQYFAARGDVAGLRMLAAYAMARHYPEAGETDRPYAAFLRGVIGRQARLVAQWMNFGFIHGVMNTDNTSISGETIDYGPCAFLEAYEPGKVFSSIDRGGRYAYGNQPNAAHWNLTRLAEALLPLLEEEAGGDEAGMTAAVDALATFAPEYEGARYAGLRRKLGLAVDGNWERDGDAALAEDLLTCMAESRADFTLTFRGLCESAVSSAADEEVRALFADPAAFDAWAVRWRLRLQGESGRPEDHAATMREVNPAFIPRNHFVQEVIEAAEQRKDFSPFEELLRVGAHPFDDQPEHARYTIPARPEQCVRQTFCGT